MEKLDLLYEGKAKKLYTTSDKISPNSCLFWDMDTNEELDRDLFRQGLGNAKVAYEEVLRRILK